MSSRRSAPKRAADLSITSKRPTGKSASPYGYPFWDWVAKEDPDYIAARQPMSELSFGEGKELSIKHKEMVIIGILAFRGRKDGCVAHMKRAIQHGATKRELLEAMQRLPELRRAAPRAGAVRAGKRRAGRWKEARPASRGVAARQLRRAAGRVSRAQGDGDQGRVHRRAQRHAQRLFPRSRRQSRRALLRHGGARLRGDAEGRTAARRDRHGDRRSRQEPLSRRGSEGFGVLQCGAHV